ncbi:sporulation protein YdcC [Paenibacillus sp. CCS19]|uniref:LolA family protein n=1 Tax=Paenibacillus sp. CCS19 TaxID=3158387 RepID=UPI00256D6EAF|nr:outer membrane lipoprotein carrier protein LolA [Paenibacillus cellulosilyticus]GMK42164.1 sporulation protein YdcC [Paenibacillus cellulosilyticus]
MRRIVLITAIMMLITVVASACGAKNADSVVKELDKVQNKLQSYQAKGTMTLNTSQQPLEYKVEVWYQKDHYYRIALTNAKKDITQIVLRNDDGVFVLTPRLNKVFRFQSDWPDNQGQVYLYQTLLSSILLDQSRQFATENDSYVFDVMANYQNGSLARQKIWLNKEDFAPRQVEVSDTNAAVMVKVTFDEFNFDPKFEKNAFDTQANLNTGSSTPSTGDQAGTTDNTNTQQPSKDNTATNGTEEQGGNTDTTGDQGVKDEQTDEQEADETTAQPLDFLELDPMYLPDGVAFKDSQEITFGGNPGIMQRYQGTYNFSIIQTQPKDVATSYIPGYLRDLGFTMGSISDGEEQQTLTWTYQGIEYRLTSADLPEDEMVLIAQSMDEGATK